MRPEPRWVQGSPALDVVQGGMGLKGRKIIRGGEQEPPRFADRVPVGVWSKKGSNRESVLV